MLAEADVRAAAGTRRPAYRDGNVLRWLSAYAASMVGDSVYFVALSWAAARSGSPGQAGLVLAVGAVP
ncbi:MFS transporter, partial [Streptomyces sp. T-3]|nr:MFS transporter [Streptomyces sp. T-3]